MRGLIPRLAVFVNVVLCGCAADARGEEEPLVVEPAPLATGTEQRERLCARKRADLVADVFCGNARPPIRGFLDLRHALGLAEASLGEEGFAMTGHSTSLVSRSVSAINPRVIFVRPESEVGPFTALAFARGERFSESVVRDRVTGELRFYLTTFSLGCDDEPDGCSPGDLLTEAVESGWKNVNLYADEDLVNTPLDCLVCHQPQGPGTPKILRMQEIEPPWSHWLFELTEGGQALHADYAAAKGDEPFVGLSGADVLRSNPGMLSFALFIEGSSMQPNAFVSREIEAEVKRSAAAMGGNQPTDNSVPGVSETWEAIYERAKRGAAIAVPYHDVKVTDPSKLARMTQAYVDYREGRLERDELPDLRDVYPDDQELLARMGFATEPGLDGEGVLMQACAQCHNDNLDQTLSRARFNVNVGSLSRAQKNRAIARLRLASDNPAVMPPAIFRTLSEEARERLIDYLER